MHRREIEIFLKAKLALEPHDRKSHIHFQFAADNGIVLPSILALSRTAELTLTNLKGLAKALGLNLNEFQESSKCHISGSVVILALSVHLMDFVDMRLAADPVVHSEGCKAMAASVHRLIHRIDKSIKIRPAERKLLIRLRAALGNNGNAHFHPMREQIRQVVENLLNDTN